MTKYNKKKLRNVFPDDKANPWTASTSERSKTLYMNKELKDETYQSYKYKQNYQACDENLNSCWRVNNYSGKEAMYVKSS